MLEQDDVGLLFWRTAERPGQLGKYKDSYTLSWNDQYGDGNWRIAWELPNGETFSYEDMFWKVYVPGYVQYFMSHSTEAVELTTNYSFAYDNDPISRHEAFDLYALYEKKDMVNQFHHVALNIALEWFLGMLFRGNVPIQVREEKPGEKWSPGRIPSVRQDLVLIESIEGWWEQGSIEDVYQSTKVLQVLQ